MMYRERDLQSSCPRQLVHGTDTWAMKAENLCRESDCEMDVWSDIEGLKAQ